MLKQPRRATISYLPKHSNTKTALESQSNNKKLSFLTSLPAKRDKHCLLQCKNDIHRKIPKHKFKVTTFRMALLLFIVFSIVIIIQFIKSEELYELNPIPININISKNDNLDISNGSYGLSITEKLTANTKSGCEYDKNIKYLNENNDAFVIDKDIGILSPDNIDKINYVRLENYDYEEVKGLVAVFNDSFITGAQSIVHDCFVTYRPGGASNTAHWNPFHAKYEVTETQTININSDAVLIASFWGNGYYHWFIENLLRLDLVLQYLLEHKDTKLLLIIHQMILYGNYMN